MSMSTYHDVMPWVIDLGIGGDVYRMREEHYKAFPEIGKIYKEGWRK